MDKGAKYIEDNSTLKTVFKNVVSLGGGNVSVSMREEDERVILMEKVLKLKKRYYYLRSEGKIYKGVVPIIKYSPFKINYPHLEG